VVCVGVLSLHDKIFEPAFKQSIQNWLEKFKINLDADGLIPHSAHSSTGKPLEEARGSSQSLILLFLKDIDPEFSKSQFDKYKSLFVEGKFGLKGILEYKKGKGGTGDIDSGPLIFGMGPAATLAGIQTLYVYGDRETSLYIRRGVEAFGLPMAKGNRKRYLFGMLPIADAFIAWSDSSNDRPNLSSSNFLTFHLYSAGIVILLCALLWMFWRSSKPSSEQSLHIPWE
jgi:hypothetical protein